jgi:hypothetical protein
MEVVLKQSLLYWLLNYSVQYLFYLFFAKDDTDDGREDKRE